MANHISLLENGGTVLVVGGYAKSWRDFHNNPRIIFWTGDNKEIARKVRRQSIPANCRAVIISRFLSHTELGLILQDVRARRLTLFANKTDGEVRELLTDLIRHVEQEEGPAETTFALPEFAHTPKVLPTSEPTTEPTPTEEVVEIMAKKRGGLRVKGKLIPLLDYVDWDKSNADNAKAILANEAKKLGIDTTFGSFSVFIGKERTKRGIKTVGRVPANKGRGRQATKKEVLTKSWGTELDVVVKLFDEAVKNLSDVRDYLIATTKENQELRASKAKMQPLLDALKGLS